FFRVRSLPPQDCLQTFGNAKGRLKNQIAAKQSGFSDGLSTAQTLKHKRKPLHKLGHHRTASFPRTREFCRNFSNVLFLQKLFASDQDSRLRGNDGIF
ncbi:TPA: hypothetical protein ACFNMI_002427, partial [Neisseria bacilliformis]